MGVWRCEAASTGEEMLSGVDVAHTGAEDRVYRGAGECKTALR